MYCRDIPRKLETKHRKSQDQANGIVTPVASKVLTYLHRMVMSSHRSAPIDMRRFTLAFCPAGGGARVSADKNGDSGGSGRDSAPRVSQKENEKERGQE